MPLHEPGGVVKNREIWATHTQYLNDRKEFVHALDLAHEELRRRIDLADSQQSKEVLRGMRTAIEGRQSINVCVASFSASRNSLSQYRAYGASSGSYAIGISGKHLKTLAPEPDFKLADQEFVLGRCIYDAGYQREVIRALIEETFREILAGEWPFPEIPGGYLPAALNTLAPVLKHQAFEEEDEWRLVLRPQMNINERFAFRQGSSTIVPYYRLPLESEEAPFRLSEIVIGPTRDPNLSIAAVKNFLVSQGLRDVPVVDSGIPFRNW